MDTAVNARKSIPKGVRFDVFKRDSFKCQYCGATAPDVLLEIDHIKPVSKGGTNDITNLITSCQACNTGKSDKLLDQNSAVAKSRTQLEQLQERREQLEMMMAWMEGLRELKDAAIDRVSNYWHELAPGYTVN
ncbi:MAG: HNH endonuclease [Planctomycetes bacterium]|nr:HNH endonuclease [Planctomycetota bacterium]